MRSVLSFGVIFVLSAMLAACGGGGGGGGSVPGGGGGGGGGATPTPVPTVTPTPRGRPYSLPSASPVVQSAYSIDSKPQGLNVTVDGTAAGKTPLTPALAYSAKAHVVTIAGTTPYTVTVAQTANGSHTIFYNQQLDTAGKIASVTPASIGRQTASLHMLPVVRRLAPSAAHRATLDDHRLVVTYDPAALRGATFDAIERASGASAVRTLAQSARSVSRAVTVLPGRSAGAVQRALASANGVVAVDRVHLRYALASTPVYPNDSHFNQSEQWDMYQIAAPAAWGYGLGNVTVTIAVIDTGYDPNQPEVAARVTLSERIVGGTIDNSAGAATDTDGHGTIVSGIASAATNNAAGWAGVGYGASLQEYKVFGDGPGATSASDDISEAIREAVANHANVILIAQGGPADGGPDPFERDAVNFALANNVTVVASSGNERASGATTVDFPAGYDGVISVGASALDDSAFPGTASGAHEYVAPYSNSGPGLGLVAPGGNPTGASDNDQIHWIENAYTTQPFAGTPACAAGTAPSNCGALFSGTSVAAAHVAGAAALLLAQHPGLTPAQLAALLDSTADDIADPNQGHGRLNVRRASATLAGDVAPFPKYVPPFEQFVAFAYTNIGQSATRPAIADLTYPGGVPVASDGTFRVADQPGTIGAYRIGVWYDANGNGVVDAGDYFGVTPVCAANGPCAGAGAVAVLPVKVGFVLP
jgi:subtilisin family serine protease